MLNSLDSLVGIEAVKQQPYLRKEVAESFCHARDLQRSHELKQIEVGGHSANAYMKRIAHTSSLPALPSDDFTCKINSMLS
eukprot:g2351.t1